MINATFFRLINDCSDQCYKFLDLTIIFLINATNSKYISAQASNFTPLHGWNPSDPYSQVKII